MEDYENILKAATSSSIKARQLAAQLIPRFFKFFPGLSVSAVDAHLDLCEAEELGVSISDFILIFFIFYATAVFLALELLFLVVLLARSKQLMKNPIGRIWIFALEADNGNNAMLYLFDI